MLKILQARLQKYVNHELPHVQAGFRKGRETRDQIANIRWIIEKAREFQKNIYFCFIDYAKAFDCMDHNKLWKTLKEMGIPDHLTCLLRNPYTGQEATVRTGQGTTDWFQIGKGVHQGCTLSPCLFNLYAELDTTEWLHFHFSLLRTVKVEKEMATHSSVIAWRIPGTGDPGGLPSMGSHRIGHDWSVLAAAAAAAGEYIMRNAGLEEAQAGINIAGWNINNLRYADDTTLMENE